MGVWRVEVYSGWGVKPNITACTGGNGVYIMKTHGVDFQIVTLHPYNAEPEDARFSPARPHVGGGGDTHVLHAILKC